MKKPARLPKKKPKRLNAVWISWEDSAADSHWLTPQEAEKLSIGQIQTIAWLVSEDKEKVRVCASADFTDATLGDVWVIPRSAIKKMRRVRLPKT